MSLASNLRAQVIEPLRNNATLMAAGALAFGLFAKETVAPRQNGAAAT